MLLQNGFDVAADGGPEAAAGNSLGEPEPHHQELVQPLSQREDGALLAAMTLTLGGREPGLRRAGLPRRHPIAVESEASMGAGTHAHVVGGVPVGEVVAAFGAGSRVIGDLIGWEVCRGEPRLSDLVEICLSVLVGKREVATRIGCGKGGAGLDGELIDREMLAGEVEEIGRASCWVIV